MSANFEVARAGSLVSVSPNGCLLAAVSNGIRVTVWTHVHTQKDQQPLAEGGGGGRPGSDPSSLRQKKGVSLSREQPTIVSTFKSLDTIDVLLWSPDCTLIAVLQVERRAIEVFDVYAKECVARIDTSLNGSLAMQWHPSSRGLFWFGLADAFLVSLIDGSTMRIVEWSHGIKTIRDNDTCNACCGSGSSTRNYAQLRALSPSTTSSDVNGWKYVEHLSKCTKTGKPLFAVSACRRWIYAVTPRVQPVLMGELEEPLEDRYTSAAHVNHIDRRQKQSPRVGVTRQHVDDVEEHLVILSSATLEMHARVAVSPSMIRAVTSFIPLLGGAFLVHDFISEEAVLFRVLDEKGTVSIVARWEDVQTVASSPSGNVVAVVRHGWTFLENAVFTDGAYRLLVPISLALTTARLQNEVCAALQEEESQQSSGTTNNPVDPDAQVWYVPMKTSGDAFPNELSSIAHCIEIGNRKYGGMVALSDDGTYIALSPPSDLKVVVVVHTLRRQVHTVLRHIDVVTTLAFSPCTPTYAALRRVDAVSGSASSEGKRLMHRVPSFLLITTDNHCGRSFLWSEDTAAVLSMPLAKVVVASSSSAAQDGARSSSPHRKPTATNAEKGPLSFHCGTALWSAGGHSVTFVDEQRGLFTSVVLDVTAS